MGEGQRDSVSIFKTSITHIEIPVGPISNLFAKSPRPFTQDPTHFCGSEWLCGARASTFASWCWQGRRLAILKASGFGSLEFGVLGFRA